MDTKIAEASREDFPAIARLLAEQNETPESQCLVSGEGYESILQTMIKWDGVSEIRFVVAVQNLREGFVDGAFAEFGIIIPKNLAEMNLAIILLTFGINLND